MFLLVLLFVIAIEPWGKTTCSIHDMLNIYTNIYMRYV